MRLGFVVLLVLLTGMHSQLFADEVVDGEIGPGSVYRMVRPDNWNGNLYLYAHGAAPRSAPVALPLEGDALINLLVPQGYAVAFSSFSENGWAVKDGAQRTMQLLGLFKARFGNPQRVYIGGASMGGLITIKLVEEHPELFAGALPICTPSGGTRLLFDYPAHVRVLFDYFYPGVLPGNAGSVPTDIDVNTSIVFPAIAAMQSNPAGALAISQIVQTPIPYQTEAEFFESIITALLVHAGSFIELSPEFRDMPYFENQETIYQGALPPLFLATLNASVARFSASPSALNYMDQYYQPSGDLQVPMVMLSMTRDAIVPSIHQTVYKNLVTASGNSNMLVQRDVDRYGHCTNFTPIEIATAFAELVAWVELGIIPAP